MKKSGLLASVVATSTAAAALASSSSSSTTIVSFSAMPAPQHQGHQEEVGSRQKNGGDSSHEKFAPRFDGLRFIETLVTAHR